MATSRALFEVGADLLGWQRGHCLMFLSPVFPSSIEVWEPGLETRDTGFSSFFVHFSPIPALGQTAAGWEQDYCEVSENSLMGSLLNLR